MGYFCLNLALDLKFKCVWLTFYLFLLFLSGDLSGLSPCAMCHGAQWFNEALAACDKETLMSCL